jgi:mercuric ion transport protein
LATARGRSQRYSRCAWRGLVLRRAFALFTLGVSGAWIGNLTALEPYQPVFAAIAAACLGYGFYLVYRKPKTACTEGSYCASPSSSRLAKIGLWTALVLVLIAVGFPRIAALFL